MNGAISTLPLAFHWLAPELADLGLPDEHESDCSSCPMATPSDRSQVVFTAKQRCCTYSPDLFNFQVGRILRRGGRVADIAREQLREGIPDPLKLQCAGSELYLERGPDEFGRNEILGCMFWQPGPLGCSVWADRNAVCRTWYCRHVDGRAGRDLWDVVRDVLYRIELILASWCMADGGGPTSGLPGTKGWEFWYLWCAERVDRLEPAELDAIADDKLQRLRAELERAHVRSRAEMPHVLTPSVANIDPDGEHVWVRGYSRFNELRLPRSIFVFLSKLDGVTTWWTADRLAADDSGTLLGESTIRTLWRLGMLEEVVPEHHVEPGDFSLIVRNDEGVLWQRSEPAGGVKIEEGT